MLKYFLIFSFFLAYLIFMVYNTNEKMGEFLKNKQKLEQTLGEFEQI